MAFDDLVRRLKGRRTIILKKPLVGRLGGGGTMLMSKTEPLTSRDRDIIMGFVDDFIKHFRESMERSLMILMDMGLPRDRAYPLISGEIKKAISHLEDIDGVLKGYLTGP